MFWVLHIYAKVSKYQYRDKREEKKSERKTVKIFRCQAYNPSSRVTLVASIIGLYLTLRTQFFFYLDRTLFNRSADSALSLSSYFLGVSDNGCSTYLCEGRRSALHAMHFTCSAEIRSGRLATPGGRNRVEASKSARRPPLEEQREKMEKWRFDGRGNVCP